MSTDGRRNPVQRFLFAINQPTHFLFRVSRIGFEKYVLSRIFFFFCSCLLELSLAVYNLTKQYLIFLLNFKLKYSEPGIKNLINLEFNIKICLNIHVLLQENLEKIILSTRPVSSVSWTLRILGVQDLDENRRNNNALNRRFQ